MGSVPEARKGELITYVGSDEEDTRINSIRALSKKVIYVDPLTGLVSPLST